MCSYCAQCDRLGAQPRLRLCFCTVVVGILLPSLLPAQSKSNCRLTLSGILIGKKQPTPIAYASIYVEELDQGTTTSHEGRFRIEQLCASKPYTLHLSHISYNDRSIRLSLRAPLDTTWHMEEDIGILEEIWIEDHKTETLLPEGTIHRDKILGSSAEDLSSALEEIAGVTAVRQGNTIARPMIDGLSGERIVILNNEVAQEDQSWGRDHAPAIDLLSQGEISVLHGPGLLRYSGSALGGMVIVRPPDLLYENNNKGEAVYRYRHNGRSNGAALRLSKGIKLSKHLGLGLMAIGSAKQSGNLHTSEYILQNTGTASINGGLHLGLRYRRWTNELRYTYFSNENAILSASHTGSIADLEEAIQRGRPLGTHSFSYTRSEPKQTNKHELWKLKSMLHLGKQQRIELTFAYQLNERAAYEVRRAGRSGTPSTHMRLHTHDLHSFWERHSNSDKWVTQVGVSARTQKNFNVPGTGYQPFLFDYRSTRYSFFGLQSLLLPKSSWEWSIRYDLWDQKAYVARDFLPERQFHTRGAILSYNRALSQSWSLHTHVGLSERPPGMNERYSQGVHHGIAAIEEGVSTLKKETSLKGELHIHCKRPSWSLEGRAYYQDVRGFVYATLLTEPRLTIRGAFPVLQHQQQDAYLRGIHLNWRWNPIKWISYHLQASAIRADNRALREPLPLMPSDRLRHELQLQLKGAVSTTISLAHQFVAEQKRYPKDSDLIPPPPSYHLLHLQASISPQKLLKGRLKLIIGAENLLGASYRSYQNFFRYFTDEPGRNLWIQLSYIW